jgi:hypothetical protein
MNPYFPHMSMILKEFRKSSKTARKENIVTVGRLTCRVHSLSTNLSTAIVDNKADYGSRTKADWNEGGSPPKWVP